jgi:hypothetical protein
MGMNSKPIKGTPARLSNIVIDVWKYHRVLVQDQFPDYAINYRLIRVVLEGISVNW